jgi:hypothetical protein
MTARELAPWHAERLRGIDIESVTSTDLSALPTMTKADLMTHWDASVIDPDLTLDRATAHLHGIERTERFDFCLGGTSSSRRVARPDAVACSRTTRVRSPP